MTLIDAIKSGRPFRRKAWKDGVWAKVDGHLVLFDSTAEGMGGAYSPDVCGILAEDYEIQEPTVTVTRSHFWDAYNQVGLDSMGLHSARPIVSAMARKLGLEPE